ncbi:phosphoribosylformylglycinamidine synthase [Aerococcaceae bacterium DSM 111020]|nr:phosphoribosylformylglycinamidine synthase [Aerococcaceae bacterium DSM 111020]
MRIITHEAGHLNQHVARLEKEAREYLNWAEDFSIKEYDIYDFDGGTETESEAISQEILMNSTREIYKHTLPELNRHSFRYRQVTGQYNETEAMMTKFIQDFLGFTSIKVHHSTLLNIQGINDEQITQLKDYYLNPVENIEVPIERNDPILVDSNWNELESIPNFTHWSIEDLKEFGEQFAMDLDDLIFTQNYFKSLGRDPNLWELKVIDTYWSDHCRHTTFNTHLDEIMIEEGDYKELFQTALNDYLMRREKLNRTNKPMTLMDLGTIQARYLRELGLLNDVEVSEEVNACTLMIKVDIAGEEEDWILYFKNETHNHPTEIEPFGGASTCLGGGVRDPLSGRSWVYQALRVGGASDPTLPFDATRTGKLPQRVISQTALAGYSDYLNQYGVTGGYNQEVYHPGFEAKRMELGALISAAPKKNIIKETPEKGDKIILLGGKTGRDGVGAAVGSSKIQTETSLEQAGAEVQKGNASVQRKIGRLFRNGKATQLIRRCNDFGAGGVAVAIGELADGIHIELDKVPVKYEGMHAGEIALSESQERMAVVVATTDVALFLEFAAEEDVEATIVATVTDNGLMTMTYQGDTVIQLHREFLDSAGAEKHQVAHLVHPRETLFKKTPVELTESGITAYLNPIHHADQHAMDEQFDASIGRATVLYPYGGAHRRTKELGMVSRLPVLKGETETVSAMAYGYDPHLATLSPFHGAYYAVIESIARLVALGFDYRQARLTFQEYFERLENHPDKWGKPVLALLGANTVMNGLELASIGGKDSMSGSYEELNVPPSLLSFAVATGNLNEVISRSFKQSENRLILIENPMQDDGTIDLTKAKQIFNTINELNKAGKILAASTVGSAGLLSQIIEMSYGNYIGVRVTADIIPRLTEPMMGSFILEISADTDLTNITYQFVGETMTDAIEIGAEKLSIQTLYEASQKTFASVYHQVERINKSLPEKQANYQRRALLVKQPRVLIPVLLGANTEYDLRDAFETVGFETAFHIIKTSSKAAYDESVIAFGEKIPNYHVIAFASGFVMGNQPKEAAKGWDMVIQTPMIAQALETHLTKGRLIFGSGSAGSSLIRTGLIEFGKVQEGTTFTMVSNPLDKFISDIQIAQIISSDSAWSDASTTHYHTALATKWGGVDLGSKYEVMLERGQILSMFPSHFNEYNIDALTSPDGLIFASVSNIERMDRDLYRNLNISQLPHFIEQAYRYFTV